MNWQVWAALSAVFAALTAIFGKIGVENIDSNFATLIRTVLILLVTAALVVALKAYQPLGEISGRTYLFLTLSALATGASWLCYYKALQLGPAAGVATIDKTSVVLVAVIAAVFMGESLTAQGWLGVVLMAGGAVLVGLKP
ncbi:MAG: EamA family transporter [Rhodospirillaceae bacterium]|nr:EamA family transporter [Rhodospirillaceae bacterium]